MPATRHPRSLNRNAARPTLGFGGKRTDLSIALNSGYFVSLGHLELIELLRFLRESNSKICCLYVRPGQVSIAILPLVLSLFLAIGKFRRSRNPRAMLNGFLGTGHGMMIETISFGLVESGGLFHRNR